MPRRDGTGPMGGGPRTGRGLGCCNGFQSAGSQTPAADVETGAGAGVGRGGGFALRRRAGARRGFGCGVGRGFRGGPVLAPAGATSPNIEESGGAEPVDATADERLLARLDAMQRQIRELAERIGGRAAAATEGRPMTEPPPTPPTGGA